MSALITESEIVDLFGRAPTDFDVSHIGDFSNQVSLLQITWPDTTTTRHVVKTPRADGRPSGLTRERRFYELHAAGFAHVPGYRGWIDSIDGLVIDWVDGLQHFSFREGPTATHEHDAVQALAQLHGRPVAVVDLPTFADIAMVESMVNEYEVAWSACREMFGGFYAPFDPLGQALAQGLVETLSIVGDRQHLLHGDAHLENLPALDAGGVCLLDWEDPMIGSFGIDLADMLVMSYPIAARRAREREIVTRYAQLLGVDAAIAWREYQRGIVQRIVRTVRQAHVNPTWATTSLPWVYERCATAAMDHVSSWTRWLQAEPASPQKGG